MQLDGVYEQRAARVTPQLAYRLSVARRHEIVLYWPYGMKRNEVKSLCLVKRGSQTLLSLSL